jgi:multidrug efflux pump subunit AcrA (membrane-fusion protein)
MNGRVLLALALIVGIAVPIAMAPHFWRQTVVVQTGPIADRVVLRAVVVAAGGVAQVEGPAGGRATKVLVREGDRVASGQVLAEFEEGESRTRTTTNPRASTNTSQITAPIDGVVLARRVDVGDSVAVASQGGTQALFEIADTGNTEVRAEIEERDATRIGTGLATTLTAPGGGAAVGNGTIARVGARVERRTIGEGEARVRADGAVRAAWITWSAPVPKVALGQQLEAHVRLPDKPSATRVLRSAVVVREGRSVVETPLLLWSREVPVEVGAADDGLVEIRGVSPGTRVFLH